MTNEKVKLNQLFDTAWDMLNQKKDYPNIPIFKDLLPKGLISGCLTLVHGNLPRNLLRVLITQMTVSLLLSKTEEMVFIDGSNIFPYYDIAMEARKTNLDPIGVLDRIKLSRAFNYHQMTEIITQSLPKLISERNNISNVLVSQISDLFLSKEALQYMKWNKQAQTYSLYELNQSLGVLKSLAIKENLTVIMTSSTAPLSNEKALGGTFLAHSVGVIIKLDYIEGKKKAHNLVLTLQKHPYMPYKQIIVPLVVRKRRSNRVVPLTSFIG